MRKLNWPLVAGASLAVLWLHSATPGASAEDGGAVVTVSQADNGSTVTIALRDRLVVELPAQFGTGFSWAATQSTFGVLDLASEQTRSRSSAAPGATETQAFTFAARSRGTADIRLVYRQPWVRDGAEAVSFSLHVVVK
jgi:predicted secreted protein